ncbi:MAG: M12 family metallo-peptidase [Planctomycetaceae bacterium]|nr:M12 family metallo-peptidase [Planctomycetaceae bacterium]
MPLPAVALLSAALPILPAPAAPAFLRVSVDGAVYGFEMQPVLEFEDAVVEVRGVRGVERTTTRRLGVRALQGSTGDLSLCATLCGESIRAQIVDHRDGSLHEIAETALVALGRGGRRGADATPILPATRRESRSIACGAECAHGLTETLDPVAPGGEADGGVAGTSCRRQCVFLVDSDFLFFQAYGPAPANTTAAIVQTMNTVDAVYEKHVGVSFATSAIIVRTDPATDPYAGLTAAGAVLDRARVEWTGTTQYERDLVHMFSGTGYSDGIAGVAWVGVVCNSYGVGMTRFADANVLCHEVGHNFNAPHCADEPCDTMCGGCLWMGPNDKNIMTSHRNAVACLSEDPAVEQPIPPDAQMDRFSVPAGSTGIDLDVLANDTDYSCEPLAIHAFDGTSPRGGTISLVGSGATARLRYTPPAGFFGSDTFNYTLRDPGGLTDTADVRVTVTTTGTILVGRVCGATAQSLQSAIDFADAAAGAEIVVAPGRYERVDFRGKPVRLRAQAGPTATFIDANAGRGVLVAGAGADGAVIEGFTIHDAAAGDGAGIQLDGADATVRNCRFIRTAATAKGGAVHARNAVVTIVDCVFDRTTAASGGAIHCETGTYLLERCDFLKTTATGGNGGAVLASGNGSCKVLSSTTSACSASGSGGALRFESGVTGQVGQSSFCGGTPNNISGAYQSLGGNTISTTCAACASLAWRNALDCDADGVADLCEIDAGTAPDANGDGLIDTCTSRADLLIAFWPTSCGGNGSAYELVLASPAANWTAANTAANARRGKLLSITSQAEADFVFTTLASNASGWSGGQGPWIGAYKASGAWRWSSGDAWGFTQWAPGEPNNSGDRGRYWTADGAIRATWDDQPSSNTAVAYLVEYANAADCNSNGSPDARDIALGISQDANANGVPDECAPPCPADRDGNGAVDAADLSSVLSAWGTAAGDIDGNGTTDAADLSTLLAAWGACA